MAARKTGTGNTKAELERYRQTYAEMFGVVPPIPNNRMTISGEVAPDFSLLAEQIRAHALKAQGRFDDSMIQAICFGFLLIQGHEASYWHARAARMAGASWAELHKIVELATAICSGFHGLNPGGAVLARLKREEAEGTYKAKP